MKRIFIALLVILFLASPVLAFDVGGRGKVLVYQSINSTGSTVVNAISTSTIPVGAKIYGYTITKYQTGSSEYVIALWDTTKDMGNSYYEAINEAEADNNSYEEIWFAYPPAIQTQLKLHQGANTVVLIYYTR